MASDPIIHFHVDDPKRRSVVVHWRGSVDFKGWAFCDHGAPVTVELTGSNGERYEVVSDDPRPDVKEFFDERGIHAPTANGFRVDLPNPTERVEYSVRFHAGEVVADGGQYVLDPFTSMQWDAKERRSEQNPEPSPSRAHYKDTWNRAAVDEDSAKVSVAGYTNEDEFDSAARGTLQVLKDTVGVHADDEILEIGCGVGRVAPVLSPLCKRWVGLDVSENMIDHARKRTEHLKNVDYRVVNGWDLAPTPSEAFDVVYCTVVFMHLDEWDRFNYVCEAKRVLRPGGRIYIDNYCLLSDAGWEFFMQHVVEIHPLDRPPNISKSSTPEELRCYLERAGFSDVQVRSGDSLWVYAWGVKPG